MGFGKKLMQKAEEIIQYDFPDIRKISVIAGVGVRQYYEKLGYFLEDEYMVKVLSMEKSLF
jgi:elongator complex protein 3